MDRDQALAKARDTAASLVGQTIYTLSQSKPNRVLSVTEEGITVAARTADLVPWDMLESVVDELLKSGETTRTAMRSAGVRGSFRSAFVFALLVKAGIAQADNRERALHLRLADE